MMIIKRLTKALGVPDTAVIADQEITELLANDGTYQGDAKWYEIILVHPYREGGVYAIERALADDECLDWSRMRRLQQEAWERMDIRDRMWVCTKNGMSRFRARSDAVPELPYDAL